jgi:hypothetical protein
MSAGNWNGEELVLCWKETNKARIERDTYVVPSVLSTSCQVAMCLRLLVYRQLHPSYSGVLLNIGACGSALRSIGSSCAVLCCSTSEDAAMLLTR